MRAVVLVVVFVAGCSFVLTGPPAAPPAAPDCTRSRFPPIADIGIAFFALVGTEISAGGGSLGSRSDGGLEFFIPSLALATASSIYGFVRTGQCRSAYAAQVGQPIPGTPYSPAPYSPPPPPPFAPPAN